MYMFKSSRFPERSSDKSVLTHYDKKNRKKGKCRLDGSQKSWVTNPSKTGEKKPKEKENVTTKHVPWGQLPYDVRAVSKSSPVMQSRSDAKHFFLFSRLGFSRVSLHKRLFLSVRGWTRGPRGSWCSCKRSLIKHSQGRSLAQTSFSVSVMFVPSSGLWPVL